MAREGMEGPGDVPMLPSKLGDLVEGGEGGEGGSLLLDERENRILKEGKWTKRGSFQSRSNFKFLRVENPIFKTIRLQSLGIERSIGVTCHVDVTKDVIELFRMLIFGSNVSAHGLCRFDRPVRACVTVNHRRGWTARAQTEQICVKW